jgi:glycine/D-amino acid oxidase-like deaminating enzyme
MNSSMIVTPPLPAEVWEAVGWNGCETVSDAAHAYAYLQRTADDRIAIGGRGVPYRYGSGLEGVGQTAPPTGSGLRAALIELLPAGSEPWVQVDQAWSGVPGVARDWCPSVGIARSEGSPDGGLAWAGGYVGDGVTTSHLAGLALADLILGQETERTTLPWIGHRARDWDPEPLRWLGVHGLYRLYRAADRAEARHPERPQPSTWAALADRVSGRQAARRRLPWPGSPTLCHMLGVVRAEV